MQSVAATGTYRCKLVESREQVVEDADQFLGSALAGQSCKAKHALSGSHSGVAGVCAVIFRFKQPKKNSLTLNMKTLEASETSRYTSTCTTTALLPGF